MIDVAARLREVRERIASACRHAGRAPSEVRLIAVTKTLPVEGLEEPALHGITDIGENRVLEALDRRKQVRTRYVWHMVGHVQTNKVKKLLEWADVLHSMDRLELACELEKHLAKQERRLPCYVQVNVSGEATKGGVRPEEVEGAVADLRISAPHLEILGLMTMAPAGVESRPHFRRLREVGERCGLRELSMGMTQDFETAIEEGATCVRIGSALFA